MLKFYTKVYCVFLFAFFLLGTSSTFAANDSANSPLGRLIEGNQRYVNSTTVCHDDWTAKRTALTQNQAPFAIIVSCSDSRVPPEIIFDQTLGHLFVVRVAGNIVDDFAIGSIEYGVSVLGANLIVVLGHSNCGAVDAALKGMKFDNHIQSVLTAIQPAVNATKGQSGNLLEKTIKANVKNVEEKLRTSRPVLANLFDKGTLSIVGGYYDLESGKVEFLDKTVSGVDPEDPKEEVKARLKEISAAVQQHKTDLLMSYWTKDAQWINTATGETLKGPAEIADSLQKRTREIEEKQFHLTITPGNITFPASNKAVVEAEAEIKDNKGQLIQRFERKITLVNQDGKWYVNQIREVETTPNNK